MNIWLRAAIASAVPAFVIVMVRAVLYAQSVAYEPGVAATELEKLPYFEAVKLLQSRANPTFGFSAFLNSARDWWFWQHLFAAWAMAAVVCFLSCALLILWARRSGNLTIRSTRP